MNIMRAVPGFPGYFITTNGEIWVIQQLKPVPTGKGYRKITLWKDRKPSQRLLHRLVLETFVGACPPGMECCHNNGVRTDNRLENLRWDTRSANRLDETKHGTNPFLGDKIHRPQGEQNGMAHLTTAKIQEIRAKYATGSGSQKTLARQYGVTQPLISLIVTRKIWKHVA